jgi:phosphoribosylglycinamide formyltransferase-1
MKKILLFASGNGSNAENIIKYFKNNPKIEVSGVFTNNPNASVIAKSNNHNIPTFVFNKSDLYDDCVKSKIFQVQPDLIVLAGFLLKFPEHIISSYPNKVINLHPALLPKYGGKGMYGIKVHQTVLANKEKETGITIHYVNEQYDEGKFIFQQKVNIENCKIPEDIVAKVHMLEQIHFPQIIEKILISNP